jgi:polyvinyl alcohol dehydrogenase (cytochrome)
MFGDRGRTLGAVASEGQAMPRLARARGRRRPRRFRLFRLRGARVFGRLAAASVLVCSLAGLAVTPAQAQATADWRAYLFGAGHSSYNAAATSIGTGNVAHLQPVWQWFEPPTTGLQIFQASPIVVNGVVYIGSETGNFYAIREATRTVLWSRNFGVRPAAGCGPLGITATAAVIHDPATGLTVYVNAPDGQLYALSAATGSTLWHATVDTPSATVSDFYAWGSPLVFNGHVYVGISSQCDNPLVPAGVVEFNQDTGAPQGSWQTIPGGQAGGSVWSSPAKSTLGDGSVFVTTGNAPNTPPNAESIVRLSAIGLSLKDSWQVPAAQQTGDADFGASPTAFTAGLNGTTTAMVGACNKNGIYYAFRQADLHDGPVWQQRIADAYGTQPNSDGQCDAAAIWDGTNLIEGGGNATTINGVTYQGSVQSLNPATGTPIWQTGLPGEVIGSPTEDGAGVVAAPVFQSNTGNYGVYLLSAASGAVLRFIRTGSAIFAQPVFAGNDLLIAGNAAAGLKAYEITTPGPRITAVTPNALGQGGSVTVTLTGSGFSGTPSVFVSATLVTASSVVVNSPTSLQVKLTVASKASLGPRNITVIEPGNIADSCFGCLTINPGPTVSSASPNSVAQGQTVNITVTGTNFQPGATISNLTGVTFSGTTVVSSTQLTSNVTISPTATLGTDMLSVTNPDGGTGACSCLTVT